MFIKFIKGLTMYEADGANAGNQTPEPPVAPPVAPPNVPPINENMIPKERFDQVNNGYKEVKAQLDALLADKALADKTALETQGKFEELYNATKAEADTYKNDYTKTTERATALEAVINELLETRITEVPEEFRDLVPANLAPEAKLAWINNAVAKGLFGKKEPQVDKPIGGNTNPKPNAKPDISTLNPLQMLMQGINSKK